jgi:23S rRNA pseudouridine2605 synthase
MLKKSVKDGMMRLNKFIANAGICSRREADKFIEAGVVSVNGVGITEMGHRVSPTDVVKFNGQRLKSETPRYVLLE